MKFNDVSFPHPILGIGDSINGDSTLNPEPEITSKVDSYFIRVNCRHDNEDLSKMIAQDHAEYFCEVTCSSTLFRKSFKSRYGKIDFEIPKKHVKGRVHFACTLVAKCDVARYQNRESHSDYDDFSFDLETGDILAYFGEFSFNADINYEKLRAVSSFMEVVENKDPNVNLTNIDLSKSKIEVQLPSSDYNIFASDGISKEAKFASIFHSSIVLNALLIGLYNLDEHKDLLWAKVIDYRLKNERQFEEISIDERQNIPEIAQRLLGDPFGRLLSDLNNMVELAGTYDDQ